MASIARNRGLPRKPDPTLNPIDPSRQTGLTQGMADNPLPNSIPMKEPDPNDSRLAQTAAGSMTQAPQSGTVDDLFKDPERLKQLASAFQPAPGTVSLPSPHLPQGPDPEIMRQALEKANTLGLVHGALGVRTPSTYEVMRTGSAQPQEMPNPLNKALQQKALMPLQMEQARVGVGNQQGAVQNQYDLERAKLGVQLGMHGSSALAALLGRYLGIQAARDAQQRSFQHADQIQQNAFGQANKMFGAHTVAKQNEPPNDATINAGRLASNALGAADQLEKRLDNDKTLWDKGLIAHLPFTNYQVGTDASKEFAALTGAMKSQLTQSDEVRRTTGNINEALGAVVPLPGDSYEVAKKKLVLFRQMMGGIHSTIATNHPLWAVQPGNDKTYSKYVDPKMIEELQKTPQQRAGEYLNAVRGLTPPEPKDDIDAFLGE